MNPPNRNRVAAVVLLAGVAGFSWFNWRSRPKPPPVNPPPAASGVLDVAAKAWRDGVAKTMLDCAAKVESEALSDVEAQKFLSAGFKSDLGAATAPVMAEIAKSVVVDESGQRIWSRAEFVRILRELAK